MAMPAQDMVPDQPMDKKDTAQQDDPMKAIQDLGASLSGLLDALGQSGAPKEVLAPLQASVQAFGEFTNMLQGKGGAQQMQTTDMNEAAGSKPAGY